MTHDLLLIFLIVDLIGMAILALTYLRTRRLNWWEWVLCGLVLLIPLIGPFLLISGQPGQARQRSSAGLSSRADRLRARRTVRSS